MDGQAARDSEGAGVLPPLLPPLTGRRFPHPAKLSADPPPPSSPKVPPQGRAEVQSAVCGSKNPEPSIVEPFEPKSRAGGEGSCRIKPGLASPPPHSWWTPSPSAYLSLGVSQNITGHGAYSRLLKEKVALMPTAVLVKQECKRRV